MNPRERIAAKFRPKEIKLYREQFDVFDLNGDGVISSNELEKVAVQLGYRLSRQEIQDIMRANDVDENGYLSFDEFLLAMPANDRISTNEHRMAEIRRKFQEYDKDGDGVVTVSEAHEVLRRELAFTPLQSRELVKKYDKNGDGHLSYEEFVNFYKKVRTKADHIKDLFHEFDVDNSGSVSVSEAKRMLRKLDMADDDIEALVALHDKNRDGELQYEEFVAFLLNS